MVSGQNPVVPLLWGGFGWRETIHIDLDEPANQKVREPICHFSGEI